MQKVIFMIFTMVGAMAFAAPQNYQIEMELIVDGRTVSKPTVVIQEGTKGTVTTNNANGEETFLEVTAKEGSITGVNGILMEMQVGFKDRAGKRRVAAKPRLLSKSGGKAQIIMNDKETGKDVVIKAVATRVR